MCLDELPANEPRMCRCTGRMQYVHRACVEKWVSTSGRRRCEFCGSRFFVVDPRYAPPRWRVWACGAIAAVADAYAVLWLLRAIAKHPVRTVWMLLWTIARHATQTIAIDM